MYLVTGFLDIRTFEILLRTYEVRQAKMDTHQGDDGFPIASPPRKKRQFPSGGGRESNGTSSSAVVARPCSEARGHTGYLTFARLKCS